MTEPLVGIGIPVWRGQGFVAETLRSVVAQRDVRLKIVVSIDGHDEKSAQACRPFAADPRVRIVVQQSRLGWVGNTAAALAAASEDADFACVQPHDDLIDPDYIATLLHAAQAHPQAAVVYSDLDAFGQRAGVDAQNSVLGPPMQRQLSLLKGHYNAVAYRGLTRCSTLRAVPPIAGNDCDDFSCDTVWMARLARTGELIRVPRVLYHKRYYAGSVHASWPTWSPDRRLKAWLRHCLDMLAEALTVAATEHDREQLMDAARDRLLMGAIGPFAAQIKALSSRRRWQLQREFEAQASQT
jgi:glycosyltransferase involved in cell wall biosynthesis